MHLTNLTTRTKFSIISSNFAVKGLTKPSREEELKGLVYALTETAHETGGPPVHATGSSRNLRTNLDPDSYLMFR